MLPHRSAIQRHLAPVILAAALAPFTSFPIAPEPGRPKQEPLLAVRKSPNAHWDDVPPAEPLVTGGSLVNIRASEILVLSHAEPSSEQFSFLLRDRVTGESVEMAPALLALLRELMNHPGVSRIEFVSGYRSWKLNEMLRKKGRNVASHSQHCIGAAMDFRVEGMSSQQLAKTIESLRWNGGLAHYPGDTDRFVHVDVGPKRRWRGL